MNAQPKKLVLVVIDAMKPSMLERAIASGRVPALARGPRRRFRDLSHGTGSPLPERDALSEMA